MNNRLSAMTRDAWIAVLLAFVLGAIFGLVVLGWMVWPVEWTNARPQDLGQSYQDQYIQMVGESYVQNHDLPLAQQRLAGLPPSNVSAVLKRQFDELNAKNQPQQAALINQLMGTAGGAAPTAQPPATSATPAGNGSLFNALALPLMALLLLIFLIVIALMLYSRLRPRALTAAPAGAPVGAPPTGFEEETVEAPRPSQAAAFAPPNAGPAPAAQPRPEPASGPAAAIPTSRVAPPQPQPMPRRDGAAPRGSLGKFVPTYKFGDDNYDTAYTLETAKGEFLGECGMGISETIGEGKPDKVTAFDLWLFDKSDVRTVTQILMSEHAYNDQTLRGRLAQKGELVLAEKGKRIMLETQTLRVEATIVELQYASTPGLPPESHFQRLVVEMNPVQKQ